MSLSLAARMIGACVLPLGLLEVGTQYFGAVGPLGPLGTATLTEAHGLQYPSRCSRNRFSGLYVNGATTATFCTDAYGTIEPTSLNALAEARSAAGAPYILACGGSTTETAVVDAHDRWVAVLAERLGVAAVNAGASAKTMATCARTIDFVLRHAPRDRPPFILVATNVNTLAGYTAARSVPHWDQSTVPEQPFAPEPLHPALRAWIPGLYHVAASVVSWLGADSSDDGYVRALAAGCCHSPAAANQPAGPRFDWQAEENHRIYARYVSNSLKLIEAVFDRHGVPRERVLFIEESNAFGFAAMPHLVRDFRQPLHGLDGRPLDLPTSAAITARYDEIYVQAVSRRFEVIRASTFDLPASAFYDAVHLTASGSRTLGERLAEILRRKLPGS